MIEELGFAATRMLNYIHNLNDHPKSVRILETSYNNKCSVLLVHAIMHNNIFLKSDTIRLYKDLLNTAFINDNRFISNVEIHDDIFFYIHLNVVYFHPEVLLQS